MRALEATGSGPGGADPNLEGSERKKMVSPASRRRAVKIVVEEGVSSATQACRALNLARSSYYRPSLVSVESRRIRKEVLELSEKHPRYGYRRITALLRRGGFSLKAKRGPRLRRGGRT